MVLSVDNMTKKEGGLQLTSLSACCLSLRINRDPHPEDLVFIRHNSLTIDAYNPAINKLIQLPFFELIEGHINTSFLPYATGKEWNYLYGKTKNPVLDPGFELSKERSLSEVLISPSISSGQK